MNMEFADSKKVYKVPRIKVFEVNVQGMLCQSGNTITGMNLLDDDSSFWENTKSE